MIIDYAQIAFIAFIALASGTVVGSSFVALLVIFDLIPRLAQLSESYKQSIWFETALICGAIYFTAADFFDVILPFRFEGFMGGVGLLNGLFIGMLAAALTEVMNVLPIIAKRLSLSNYMVSLMMAMVFGKIIGSLYDWLVFSVN